MAIILDSGPLFALADTADAHHREVVSYLDTSNDILIVPVVVLPEVSYLVNKHLGVQAEVQILRSIVGGEGRLRLEGVTKADLTRAIDLISQYSDAKVGLVDGTIVAVAERLNIRTVLTLDRRHFSAFRPSHCTAFEVVP